MANRRRNGRRGRGRGTLYSRPIPEPANFVEFDMPLTLGPSGPSTVTLTQIFTALSAAVPTSRIQKYRVSSLVIDPIVTAGVTVPTDVEFGISGQHYQSFQSNRPLRVRLGKGYMQDGMWVPVEGTAPNWPAPFTGTDPFIRFEPVPGADNISAEMHVRVAYTDPS